MSDSTFPNHPLEETIDELLLMYLNISRPLSTLIQLKEEQSLDSFPVDLQATVYELCDHIHELNISIFHLLNHHPRTRN